jgi:ABC-type cobalamin/Fe3+-siderophores transport system ATPase subunit
MFHGDMGSGKSLILDILTKKNSGYEGQVLYDSDDLKKISNRIYKNDFSMVAQESKKPFFGNVYDYIYKYVLSKNKKDKASKYTDSIISKMNLKYIKSKKIRNLTPNQFRWVDLSSKIAASTKVLFIDEIDSCFGKQRLKVLSKILYRKCNYDGVTLVATCSDSQNFTNLTSVLISIKNGRISSIRSKNKKK